MCISVVVVLIVYAEPGAFDLDLLQAALADSGLSLEAFERTLRQLHDQRQRRPVDALHVGRRRIYRRRQHRYQ